MNIRIKNIVFFGIATLSLATKFVKAEQPASTLEGKELLAWNMLMGQMKHNFKLAGLDAVKAVVNIKGNKTGNTPLHMAGNTGNQDFYNKLLSLGADATIKNNNEATAQDLLDLALLEKELTGTITHSEDKKSSSSTRKVRSSNNKTSSSKLERSQPATKQSFGSELQQALIADIYEKNRLEKQVEQYEAETQGLTLTIVTPEAHMQAEHIYEIGKLTRCALYDTPEKFTAMVTNLKQQYGEAIVDKMLNHKNRFTKKTIKQMVEEKNSSPHLKKALAGLGVLTAMAVSYFIDYTLWADYISSIDYTLWIA